MQGQGPYIWSFDLTWMDKGAGERRGGAHSSLICSLWYVGVLSKRMAGCELVPRCALILCEE